MSSNITKQAAWIALGSLCSFGFGIVSSMILSRYFDKDDYGTYKQVLYVYNTLLTVFTLGLPRAYSYFLPRIPIEQAHSLIRKISNLFIILGLLFSLLLFLSADVIAIVLRNPNLTNGIRWFSVVPLLLLPTMGLEGILATYQKSMYMAVYMVLTRVVMLIFVVAPIIIWKGGYIHAIIGFDIASIISFFLAVYLKYIPVKNVKKEKVDITYNEIFKFSFPLLFASLWGIVISSADQFFVSRYYGAKTFADFANGSMDLPFIGMIIGTTTTVLSPVFSKMNYDKLNPRTDILPIWESAFKKSAMLIYPFVIYCLFFADIVMKVLYGGIYETSAVYFRLRLLTNFFTLVAFAPLLINTGKVKLYSNVHMYGAIILVLLEFFVVKTIDSATAVCAVSSICTIGRIMVFLIVISKYFEVKIYELFPYRLIFFIIMPSSLILFLERIIIVDYLEIELLTSLVISLVIYGILFLAYCRFVKIDYLSILKQLRR